MYDDFLCDWWRDWRWTPPKREFLPDNGASGLIVYDGDVPVCAGFVYVTNSAVAWVDWIISNYQYKDRSHRRKALSLLVDSLTEVCKGSGYRYVYALIKNQSLINVYKEAGYIQGASYNSEMIKII